jgi:hypothetical protein
MVMLNVDMALAYATGVEDPTLPLNAIDRVTPMVSELDWCGTGRCYYFLFSGVSFQKPVSCSTRPGGFTPNQETKQPQKHILVSLGIWVLPPHR